MKFFVRRLERDDRPLVAPSRPAVFLLQDMDWNDYRYVTTFVVRYLDAAGNQSELGRTKILQRGQKTTVLPKEFKSLPKEFCSLGQSLEYYQALLELGHDTAHEILNGLRDVAFDPAYQTGHAETEGFKDSLLRFSEAAKAYKEAGALFGRATDADKGFDFSFTCQLTGFSRPHVTRLDFRPLADLPHRVITFVASSSPSPCPSSTPPATGTAGCVTSRAW